MGYQTPTFTIAAGVNTAGTVVGYYTSSESTELACKWNSSSSSLTPLDPVGMTGLGRSTAFGGVSQANGINTAGLIVGNASTTDGVQDAFLYSGTKMYDLGTHGGTASTANAINDNGLIVGNITNSDGSTSAFSYAYNAFDPTSGTSNDTQLPDHFSLLDPGTTPIFSSTNALSVNLNGSIVGDAVEPDGITNTAFLYQPGNGIESINSLVSGSTLDVQFATGINDAGAISGYAVDSNGNLHAVLLTPGSDVPEPASIGILSLMSGALLRRRRQP